MYIYIDLNKGTEAKDQTMQTTTSGTTTTNITTYPSSMDGRKVKRNPVDIVKQFFLKTF